MDNDKPDPAELFSKKVKVMEQKRVFRIIFFSGTGNTAYVMAQLQEHLCQAGYACEALAVDTLWAECGQRPGQGPDEQQIKKRLVSFLEKASVLILAFPTYASDLPRPLKELLPNLPDGNGMELAVVSTITMAGGDACRRPIKMLASRGYRPLLAMYVKMPNNIKLPPINYPEIKNGEALQAYYESARKTIKTIAANLAGATPQIMGTGLGNYLLGLSQRAMEPFLLSRYTARMFATANCAKCALCARACPMANIKFERGYPEFGPRCCLCLRCYNFCPKEAIQITEKTRNTAKYPRYKGFNNWKPPRLFDLNPAEKPG